MLTMLWITRKWVKKSNTTQLTTLKLKKSQANLLQTWQVKLFILDKYKGVMMDTAQDPTNNIRPDNLMFTRKILEFMSLNNRKFLHKCCNHFQLSASQKVNEKRYVRVFKTHLKLQHQEYMVLDLHQTKCSKHIQHGQVCTEVYHSKHLNKISHA